MSSNLTTVVATQQALSDPERESRYIGLLSGDYLMLPQKHTGELAKELLNLDLVQGYLVRRDADPNLPLESRAQNAVPGISYASMRIGVSALDASSAGKSSTANKTAPVSSADDSSSDSSTSGAKKGGSGKPGSGKSASGSKPK